ncbi:MAG TPA: PH domain-containing protein, partial [Candidatus Saccharimonadales bacterium]
LLGGFLATYIYNNNRFYLTNESVIQEIQTSLFSKHEQTVSLSNVEDASYRQNGLLQIMLNYGSIRLSTEGDETTYRFSFVANPKQHIAILNNAVEAFKNGRPVDPPHQDQPS